MAADLNLTVSLDTTGFDRGIDSAERQLDGLAKSTDRVSKQRLDIAPTGARELDAAGKSAEGLSKGLDGAAKSADRVKAPTGVARDLDAAGKSAGSLSRELDSAAGASSRLRAPAGMESVLSSSSSAAGQLAGELDRAGSEAQQLGSAGDGLGGFEASLSGLASMAKNLVPTLGAAASASAVFTKGWDRLTSIDNAQFKLQGLGHTTESTADIMNSAMDSVKGTAYGFGDAASLAAGTVAATGAEGERLTQILTTVADTAAISGRSLGDMGLIFNQVAASGTLMGDDLNQLMDAGIPVLQMLGDEMGVTAAEVKSLASDGQVSFEIFEAAMRTHMGGAAVEMGQSVTGALANVGAAAGRLGAEVMSGGFGLLPDVLSGITSGIDVLTDSVSTLTKWFDGIPGPIKTMAAALLTARAGTAALNTELGQKLVDNLKGTGDGIKGFGSNVVGAFRDMGTAYSDARRPLENLRSHHLSAAESADLMARQSNSAFERFTLGGKSMGRSFAATTTGIAGHMRGAVGAIGSGVGSVVNALGGPLNLALAGAGLAISAYVNANNKAKKAQEAMATATQESADAQRDLFDAVKGTSGALDEQAISAAARVVKAELTEIIELGEAYSSWLYKVDTDTNVWERIFNIGDQWGEDTRAAQELRDSYEALEESLEEVGLSKENLDAVVAEGGNSYSALIEHLRGSGEAGERMADELEGARAKILDVTEAAQNVDSGMVDAAAAIDQIAESAGDADKKLSGMINALQVMGLLPQDAQQDLMELGEAIRDVANEAQGMADAANGALGSGLFGDDGRLDHMNANAELLQGHLQTLSDEFLAVASSAESTEDIHQAFRDMEPALDALQQHFQLSNEEMETLLEQFGLMPDEVSTLVQLEGTEGAVRDLGDVWTAMYSLEEGATINVGVISEGAAAILDSIGYQVEELDNGTYEVTVGTEDAQNNLGKVIEQASGLNGIMYSLTEVPHQIEVHSSQITDDTRAIIAEMQGEISSPDMNGQVRVTFPEGSAILGSLSEIGIALTRDLDGEIRVDTYDVDAAKARLDELSIASKIEDGRLIIDSNDPEVRRRLVDLGWMSMIDGKLTLNDNIPTLEDHIRRLDADADHLGGFLHMGHNAPEVSSEVDRSLQGKTTHGKHIITEERRVTYWQSVRPGMSAAEAARVQGPVPIGGQTGGRFTRSGFEQLPAYAEGYRHDGYRLPGTGPGTSMTDGFLALDQYGMPVARLDADEWVINGDSSEKHDALLAAVNADNPTAMLAAVLNGIPALADGGSISGEYSSSSSNEYSPSSSGEAPMVEGGTDTTTSVLDHDAMLGDLMGQIPEEKTTRLTLTAEGVADELATIGQRLEPLGEGETIIVDAMGEQALSVLDAVGVETTSLPDGSVEVHAATGDALDALGDVSQMLFEVGDVVVEPEALLDTRELEVSAEDAQIILDALDIENPTPYASLIIDDLLNGKGIAQGELEFLASMVPTPAADLNTALLEAGVQVSESELQRVGNQKATSVVDVNNQSALQNVQATLDALNRMPVERTIRIVAAGSAASAIGQYNQGGRIPALASGGRLPTTGPGTDRTDGILGMGSDGVPTAMVDAGEWVITKNRSEQFNRTLGAINAGNQRDIYEALKMDLPGMPELQHLAKGGVVSPEQLLDFAAGRNVNGQQASRSLQGAPYIWGGVNWGDCSGAMAGLANFAAGLNAFGSRFATMNQREATAALGFKPGLGDPSTSFNLGWFNGGPWGGHTSGDIGGTAVEMGGGAGGQGKIGGAAASASSGQYTDHAHLTLGELWAFDLFRALPALTQRYQPAPEPSWQTEGGDGVAPGGLGLQVAQGLGGGVSHTGGDGVHFNDGTVIPYERGRLYDVGGIWPTGTWGFNSTGQDELVLPPRETEQFKALPEAAEAMHAVADAVGGLHPELRRMVDNVAPQIVGMASSVDQALGHLQAIADYQTAEGMVARATAGRVLDMDILPWSSELQGILDAEAQLWDARAAQEDRARAITEAENSLSEARAELSRLQSEEPGMSVQDQRKIADAEEAVAKARADGDAEKVADAEQKLARTREDVAASTSEDAVKRQEDIAKATDNVSKAEQDLTQARRESVAALDQSLYSVLPQLNHGLTAASTQLGGLASQFGAMGGLAADVAPMLGGVAGQLAGVAAFAGPAGISIGMALSIVQTVLSVAREIGSIIGDLAEAASAGRTAAAQAHAESVSAIREWTSVVDQQRQTVSRLRQSVVRAEMEIVSAQWEVRTAQLDVGRAQLEGVRSVAEAEAALAAERERQARADWWQYNDLTLAYDRLRWAQQDVAYGQLEDYATVTPEIMALQHEVLAAQLTSAGSVHAAQLASLQASFGLMEAQKLLARGQRDLNHAMAEYNRMSGTSFGLTTPEAIVAEEIARLQAENARLAGENPQASGLLGGLDFNNDGRIIFGLFDLVGQERNALHSAIDANNKAIENLLNSGHAPDWDEATWAEAMGVIDQAAEMYRHGNDASAEALIAGSIWGDADRALNENRVLDEIAQWEQSQRELEDDISDLQDMIEFEEMAQPLRELIAALEAGANSAQYSADALREQNPAIREALEALAEFEGGAARDIRDGRPIQHVTIVGENFSAEQIQSLLDQLAGHGQELEVRVERLEQPDRPTARDVMAARK